MHKLCRRMYIINYHKKIKVKNSNFNLKRNYDQEDLIEDIKKIHRERLEHGLNKDTDNDSD